MAVGSKNYSSSQVYLENRYLFALASGVKGWIGKPVMR
jgi:hypothetical protein